MDDFIEKIEKFMIANNLTVKQLSKQIGIDRSYLSQIINGKKLPSTRLIKRINFIVGDSDVNI